MYLPGMFHDVSFSLLPLLLLPELLSFWFVVCSLSIEVGERLNFFSLSRDIYVRG